jgi:hypothetical protein
MAGVVSEAAGGRGSPGPTWGLAAIARQTRGKGPGLLLTALGKSDVEFGCVRGEGCGMSAKGRRRQKRGRQAKLARDGG